MAFDPDESIKLFQSYIDAANESKADAIEIPLNEFRVLFNHFQIMKHLADRSSHALGELKGLADQGKLIRLDD
ncbi:hypothetical protein KIH86_03740 [Paenibacillus sp. HN-1]|uniref:hypothetical protein n=1 Tax=Paenibacillus TaxID=44249 RepID=UPI001CA9912A|nr:MULTISPECIES: hypothetical protein [Paenibacillus]MBY9077295.1 hypothetical protein [Paenibacillus sp. CGMCC 1.18879]MBY9083342.1 hypothetical protein [Paenibacillus sinensis]